MLHAQTGTCRQMLPPNEHESHGGHARWSADESGKCIPVLHARRIPAIALTTIAARSVLLPAVVLQMKNTAKMSVSLVRKHVSQRHRPACRPTAVSKALVAP